MLQKKKKLINKWFLEWKRMYAFIVYFIIQTRQNKMHYTKK